MASSFPSAAEARERATKVMSPEVKAILDKVEYAILRDSPTKTSTTVHVPDPGDYVLHQAQRILECHGYDVDEMLTLYGPRFSEERTLRVSWKRK